MCITGIRNNNYHDHFNHFILCSWCGFSDFLSVSLFLGVFENETGYTNITFNTIYSWMSQKLINGEKRFVFLAQLILFLTGSFDWLPLSKFGVRGWLSAINDIYVFRSQHHQNGRGRGASAMLRQNQFINTQLQCRKCFHLILFLNVFHFHTPWLIYESFYGPPSLSAEFETHTLHYIFTLTLFQLLFPIKWYFQIKSANSFIFIVFVRMFAYVDGHSMNKISLKYIRQLAHAGVCLSNNNLVVSFLFYFEKKKIMFQLYILNWKLKFLHLEGMRDGSVIHFKCWLIQHSFLFNMQHNILAFVHTRIYI